jgi:hypothetical protein
VIGKGTQVNPVTENFIRKFKAGDLVDLKVGRKEWKGPYELAAYEIDPPKKGSKPAAHMKIKLEDDKIFERWLIAEDQAIIRAHISEQQKQRVKAKRVK